MSIVRISIRSSFEIARFDRDLAALRSEFHRVLDQVPKDLLQPRRVAVDVVVLGLEPEFELEFLLQDILAANLVERAPAFRGRR